MRRWLFILLTFLILPWVTVSQNVYEQRGVQYATHGTDFWVCFPRTFYGSSPNRSCLYIMAEHDCDVTIRNDVLDYTYVHHVISCHEINSRLDTLNTIELPLSITMFYDTIQAGVPSNLQRVAQPQPRSFHITSTDTICVYLFNYSKCNIDVTNVLPTEMLRDEYVLQTYPCKLVRRVPAIHEKSSFEIIATEDSTVVDIVLADLDWLGNPKGTVVTKTLNKGMLYHFSNSLVSDKYNNQTHPSATIHNHTFDSEEVTLDTCVVDLSGTYVRSHDNKKIAVFQGNQLIGNPYGIADMVFEQAMPIRYAGKEFLIPNIFSSNKDIIRITGLVDNTEVTITDPLRSVNRTRTLHVDARQTNWFLQDTNEGPFYVTSNHPILITLRSDYAHCGAGVVVIPVEWWHSGLVNWAPVYYVDANGNGYLQSHSTHVFTRTEDVSGMHFDHYLVDDYFTSLPGTPFSYAPISHTDNFNARAVHIMENWLGKPFWAIGDAVGSERSLFSYSHIQKGKNYLTVNDIPAEELNPDSNWCMYDPICFQGWVERPADSIIWEFGDGLVERYLYEDGQNVTHTYADTGRFTVNRIIKYKDEGLDSLLGYVGCKSVFTRPPDTMSAHIWVRSRIDTSFAVKLCEGSYFFRGYELATTDTHYVTTYWTESGCDTLWKIDLTTCPHCSFYSDTISDEQLPWTFNDITFAHETRHYPIYIDIGDECDSIIDYYLIVIPHWGEPPLDTTFILAPNVIIPNSDIEANRRFRLFCSKDIEVAEVYVFDRVGRRLAHFDGLTEEWDGTYKGVLLPQGTYVYYVRYKDGSNRNWKTTDGTFSIIR